MAVKYTQAMSLPDALYTPAQIRDLEARAIAQGCSSYELMQRAGAALLVTLRAHWPQVQRVAVVCGGGNNGGDGYELARLAHAAGLTVKLLAAADPARLQGDALGERLESLRCRGRRPGKAAHLLGGPG